MTLIDLYYCLSCSIELLPHKQSLKNIKSLIILYTECGKGLVIMRIN